MDATPTTYAEYDRSLDRLVMLDQPIHEQIRAAFEAGRAAERAHGNRVTTVSDQG